MKSEYRASLLSNLADNVTKNVRKLYLQEFSYRKLFEQSKKKYKDYNLLIQTGKVKLGPKYCTINDAVNTIMDKMDSFAKSPTQNGFEEIIEGVLFDVSFSITFKTNYVQNKRNGKYIIIIINIQGSISSQCIKIHERQTVNSTNCPPTFRSSTSVVTATLVDNPHSMSNIPISIGRPVAQNMSREQANVPINDSISVSTDEAANCCAHCCGTFLLIIMS